MTPSVPYRDALEVSWGKFDRCPRTAAGSTLYVFDGYGLCGHLPARPTFAPHIRFLFIGSRFCSMLPPDPSSRESPCTSLPFTSIRLGEVFHLRAIEHAQRTK
jgi:hypothetical protein